MSSLSIIITAHNEGDELRRTVESVRANTRSPFEILVVDDGSTDGSCDALAADDLKIIRHERRQGVAPSRNAACAVAAGDVFAFLDGHQRVSDGCLNQCADLALERKAIVWPDVQGLAERGWTGHGASLKLCGKKGYFSARWHRSRPSEAVSSISTLVVPGYVMPRDVYQRVRWIGGLRGWGASEPAVTVKAFFLGIDVLHLCGPLARHLFRNHLPYATPWEAVWRNHALVARVCFDDRTWFEHWLPQVFWKHLTDAARRDLESPELLAEHETFLSEKVRSDAEFFDAVGKPLSRLAERGCCRTGPLSDEEYIRQQRRRSKPAEYKTIRPRVDGALKWLAANLPDGALQGGRVLDVGTRDGYAVEALRNLGAAEAGGIELVPETAAYAASRGRTVRQGDMRKLSDADGAWDIVTSIHSLEHCPQPQRAVTEMARVLRSGGRLFLVVPREGTPDRDPMHNCAFPDGISLRKLILDEPLLDSGSIREDVGVLAKGCRELRLLVQKR